MLTVRTNIAISKGFAFRPHRPISFDTARANEAVTTHSFDTNVVYTPSVLVLHRVLHPKVHVNGFKKKKKNDKTKDTALCNSVLSPSPSTLVHVQVCSHHL